MRSKVADKIIEEIRNSKNKEISILGLKLKVSNNIYIPGGESVLLAKNLNNPDFGVKNGEKVLDYGCGSGFLGIVAAKLGGNVISVDLNNQAVKITKENALLNNVKIDVRLSNGFEKIKDNEKFDVILASLPYEDAEALDELELSVYDPKFQMRIALFDAGSHLTENGRIFFTYSKRVEESVPIESFIDDFIYEVVDSEIIDGELYFLYLIRPK